MILALALYVGVALIALIFLCAVCHVGDPAGCRQSPLSRSDDRTGDRQSDGFVGQVQGIAVHEVQNAA